MQVVSEKNRKKATYLSIDWNAKKIGAPLDTGGEVSVIGSGRRLLLADIELTPPKKHLFAANRTNIPLLGSMDMEFTVLRNNYSVTLAVTNAVDDMILGYRLADRECSTLGVWTRRAKTRGGTSSKEAHRQP